MKLSGTLFHLEEKNGSTYVEFAFYGNHGADLEKLWEKVLDVEVKQHRKRRSINANALCWELCSQIGKALTPPVPKEEIYRNAIRNVGVYEDLLVREEFLDAFMQEQDQKGIGWFAEVVGEAPLRGWMEVHAYSGSSVYNTKEMSLLIDSLIDDAQQMELPISYDLQEIDRIKKEWEEHHNGNN